MADMWERYDEEMTAAARRVEKRAAALIAKYQREEEREMRQHINREPPGISAGFLFFALCVCVLVATVMAHYAAAEWTELNRIQIEGQQ